MRFCIWRERGNEKPKVLLSPLLGPMCTPRPKDVLLFYYYGPSNHLGRVRFWVLSVFSPSYFYLINLYCFYLIHIICHLIKYYSTPHIRLNLI